MNSKHTSGPWKLGRIGTHEGRHGRAIYGPQGEQVADLSADLLPEEEQLANARLIAAAPELLEALQHLTEWAKAANHQLGYTKQDVNTTYALKVIRKALGQ